MSLPAIAGIADAMLPYIKAAGITDAERHFISYTSRDQLATRRVTVVPKNERLSRGSRQSDGIEYELEVHVEQEVDPSDDQTIANLVYTSETLFNLWAANGGSLRGTELNGCKPTGELEFDLDQIYDPEALRDDRLYTSVIVVRYRNDN